MHFVIPTNDYVSGLCQSNCHLQIDQDQFLAMRQWSCSRLQHCQDRGQQICSGLEQPKQRDRTEWCFCCLLRPANAKVRKVQQPQNIYIYIYMYIYIYSIERIAFISKSFHHLNYHASMSSAPELWLRLL